MKDMSHNTEQKVNEMKITNEISNYEGQSEEAQ